jgi:uncharacterized protein
LQEGQISKQIGWRECDRMGVIENYRERCRRRESERQEKLQLLLNEYGSDIINSENFNRTKEHIQHGTTSVRNHCLDVACYSLVINKKLRLGCNKRDLVRGALLHDYFLYDWHDKAYLAHRQRLHGFHHPATALRNAEKEYTLTDRQRDIIRKHMWPLTIVPPVCEEAWVVSLADKYCSFRETFGLRGA